LLSESIFIYIPHSAAIPQADLNCISGAVQTLLTPLIIIALHQTNIPAQAVIFHEASIFPATSKA